MVLTSGLRRLYITAGDKTDLPLPDGISGKKDPPQGAGADRPAASHVEFAPAKTCDDKPDDDEAGSC